MYNPYSILKHLFLLPLLSFSGWLMAQPTVDLGADTILCGPTTYTLDAGNTGATFLWNTGDQTQTLLVDSSAFYIVTVTDGTGSTSDTVYVGFAPDPQTPSLSDTTFCGSGIYELVSQNNGGTIFWYDSTGQNVIAVGDTLETFLDQGTQFKAEARGVVDTSSAGFATVIGPFFAITNDRGLFFDVKIPALLGTVEVDHQGTQSGEIQLYDPAGNLIVSHPVNLMDGMNTLPVYANLTAGQGYRLMLANLSGGGSVQVQLPVTFPFDYEVITITEGTPISNHYNYFKNWSLYIGGACVSMQDSITVGINALPPVDLGADTVLCGANSLLLDAGNPGSSYLWSTSNVSQTLSVFASSTYDVVVTNPAGCEGTDSIYVGFAPDPITPTGNDTVFCGPGVYNLLAQNNGGTTFWYDSSGQTVLFVGDVFATDIQQDDQFILESRGVVDTSSAGFSNVNGGFFAIINDRGTIFDVKVPIVLGTVEVAHQGTQTAVLELFTPDNTLLFSDSITLVDGINTLSIYTALDPGTGYRLMLTNLGGGGSLNVQLPITFPLDYSTITLIGGTPIADHYNYFYNWTTFIGGICQSGRDTMQASISPLPEISLGMDTVFCDGDSVVLDAGNAGSTYLWSDLSVDQTLTVDTTSFFDVTVTNPFGCQSADTVFIGFVDTPSDPVVADTSFCSPGSYQIVGNANGGKLLWLDASGQNVLGIGDTLSLDIAEDVEFLAVSQGVIPGAGAGRLVPTGGFFAIQNDRGLIFNVKAPILLEKVSMEVQGTLSATLAVYDGQGTLLFSRFYDFNDGNNELFLGLALSPGTDYRIMLEGLSGGGSIPVNLSNNYPLVYPLIDITSGTPIVEHYNYFYDWEISIGGVCISEADTVQINVALPIDLPDSIYSCDATVLDASIPNANYLWSTSETTSSIQISETGLYSVVIDDGAACQVFDSTFVEIPQTAGLPEDGILCGNTLTTNYGPDAIFDWSTGDSTETIEVTMPGTYSVIVNEPRGCVLTDTIVITGFDSFPVIDLGADLSECDSVTLGSGNDPTLSYIWSTGETTPEITVYASGTYSVSAANVNNCADADTIGVLITPIPTADFFFVVTNFTVNFINLSTFATPQWNFGDGNSSSVWAPSHTYLDTGTYTVQLIVSNVCGADTIELEVQIEAALGVDPGLALPSLLIYPNPTQGWMRLEVEWPDPEATLYLMDNRGRLLEQQDIDQAILRNGFDLDISGLPAGMYYLRLRGSSGTVGRAILRQ